MLKIGSLKHRVRNKSQSKTAKINFRI